MIYLVTAVHILCLFFHHHRGLVAERNQWGHICGFWWTRQSNGFRSSRGGECAFEGDHLVSGCVYDHFDHPIGLLQQAQRSILGLAGSEVRTGEDATRAASGNALYSANNGHRCRGYCRLTFSFFYEPKRPLTVERNAGGRDFSRSFLQNPL